MNTSEQINELAAALAAAQAEMKPVAKTKPMSLPGRKTYYYADVGDVLSSILPTLAKHKLSIVQATVIDDGVMLLETRLLHASGQWLASSYPVCSVDGNHQRMGAAVSYARRYALSSLIGVAAEDDTDGEGAEDVKAPAKKANGPEAAAYATASGAKVGRKSFAQQAVDNFEAYFDMVDHAFRLTKTIDDLSERSAYYGDQEVKQNVLPPDWDRLCELYDTHKARIEGARR